MTILPLSAMPPQTSLREYVQQASRGISPTVFYPREVVFPGQWLCVDEAMAQRLVKQTCIRRENLWTLDELEVRFPTVRTIGDVLDLYVPVYRDNRQATTLSSSNGETRL